MAGGYDRAMVERLLPILADPDALAWGLKNEEAPDADMPRAVVKKKKGSSYPAMVTDIRHAWKLRAAAGLSLDEQRATYLRYAVDMTVQEAGALLGVRHQRISERAERGVGKLTAFLNGEKYIDGYDGLAEDEAA
ncbi:DNA binding protein [Streptomyces phage VieEnRose]|nr:DNA binding protein [Streptomyces phage VieEnRose]